jgi:uncharacterized membrane protein YraQ (UPF0718 family)
MTTTDVDSISRTSAQLTVARPNSAIALLQGASALARRIDRVVLSLVLLMLVLAIFDAQLARRTLGYVASELVHLGPWFTLSVLFAAFAKATGGDAIVARAFAGREGRMIPLAAIVGGLTPFCSCGVIPLVAGLFGAGVPLAPVMAFWIASPLMDPTQFFVIAGSLGVGFAIAKTAAAIGMGLLGGYGTMLLTRTGLLSTGDALRITVERNSCCKSAKQGAAAKQVWRFWEEGERAQVFLTASVTTAWFLIRWLALAFVIESLMTAWLPPEVIARWLGTGPFAIPLAVLIGVPVYINGLAAVPFVAGLIQLGMSPPAGLAFMLATTATGFAAMTAVWALVRPKVFALYLAFAVLGALLAGHAYELVLAVI